MVVVLPQPVLGVKVAVFCRLLQPVVCFPPVLVNACKVAQRQAVLGGGVARFGSLAQGVKGFKDGIDVFEALSGLDHEQVRHDETAAIGGLL